MGWHTIQPQTQKERNVMWTKCGQKCFLVPPQKTKNGWKYRYPVCPKGSCQVSTQGLAAANRRARLVMEKASIHHHPKQAAEHRAVVKRSNRLLINKKQ